MEPNLSLDYDISTGKGAFAWPGKPRRPIGKTRCARKPSRKDGVKGEFRLRRERPLLHGRKRLSCAFGPKPMVQQRSEYRTEIKPTFRENLAMQARAFGPGEPYGLDARPCKFCSNGATAIRVPALLGTLDAVVLGRSIKVADRKRNYNEVHVHDYPGSFEYFSSRIDYTGQHWLAPRKRPPSGRDNYKNTATYPRSDQLI